MQNRNYKIVIISLFTLIQLIILVVFGYTPYPDSDAYVQIAKECINAGEPYPVSSLIYHYGFLWNIGAINLVALSLSLTSSVIPLLVVYALIKGVTAWLFHAITLHITNNHRTAFIALLIYVIYPANYGECTSTLSELPFLFFSLLALWLAICKRKQFIGGILFAIAAWIRPFSLIFIVVLCVCWLIKDRQWRYCLKLVTGYALTVVFIGSLTMLRTGLFLYQAKTGWMALSQYSWDHSPESHDAFPVNPGTICYDASLTVSDKDRKWQEYFFSWVSENKAAYLSQMPRKLLNTYVSDNVNFCTFLSNKDGRDYLYDEVSMGTIIAKAPRLTAVQWLTVINLLVYYALLLLSVLSLLYFKTSTHLLPVLVILLGTLMLLFLGHGEARFHQLFMPFFIMLAATFSAQKIWKG